MEQVIIFAFLVVLAIAIAYSAMKIFNFLKNEDFSVDRYTYETKEINGEIVEVVIDKNDVK